VEIDTQAFTACAAAVPALRTPSTSVTSPPTGTERRDRSSRARSAGAVLADCDAAAVAAAVDAAAAQPTVEIAIDLGLGEGHAGIWASDLSKLYVELNAEYTT
jgi:hypothetical protein